MDAKSIKHLLVVDDDVNFLNAIASGLSGMDYQVSTAESGAAARKQVQENAFDLVLLDAMMPEQSGFDVLRWIRTHKSPLELPVIMVTGLDDNDSQIEALALGANDYIAKPFDPRVALARIQLHLTLRALALQNDEFFSIATHDIKKPLALVIDAVETLRESDQPPADYRDILDMVYSSCTVMRDVVHDFLNLKSMENKPATARLVRVDIGKILRETVAYNRNYADQKNIRLELELPNEIAATLGDPHKLVQIADNLIGNAIKFSPGGTAVRVTCQEEAERLCVKVCDEGPGFTPDNLKHAFEKYANLGNKPTGNEVSTGLGLAICKRLVGLLGGEISVANNAGPGATFSVHLPRAPNQSSVETHHSAA